MSRNGSFLSLARAMNCGTFSIVPISINILNAPSLAPPCAGPQRHANSLIPRFNSLLEFKKFPVRLRREFACKPLNLLIDWHKNRTERQESANFPVNFPVSREFASQTASPLMSRQPVSPVSGVLFPGGGESPTFPQVRLGWPSLWSA